MYATLVRMAAERKHAGSFDPGHDNIYNIRRRTSRSRPMCSSVCSAKIPHRITPDAPAPGVVCTVHEDSLPYQPLLQSLHGRRGAHLECRNRYRSAADGQADLAKAHLR
jgi:hypothetical protein